MGSQYGKLTVVYGPMFAGKTTFLLLEAERLKRSKVRDFLVFKPKLDNRYAEAKVVNHKGESIDAIPVENAVEAYREVVARGKTITDVFFDEAQFFPEDTYRVIEELFLPNGINVIAAGLNTDFRGEPFPTMAKLIAVADDLVRLKAVCKVCGSLEATMTQRIVNGKPARKDDPVIVLGAEESYEARCREHHELL